MSNRGREHFRPLPAPGAALQSLLQLTVSLYLALILLPFMLAVTCKTELQSVLNIPDLIFKQGPVDLDLVYNTSDVSSSLFTLGSVSPSGQVDQCRSEEYLHHPLVVI